MILSKFIRLSHGNLYRWIPVLLLVTCLCTSAATAQDRAKQGSPYDPRDAVGFYYDHGPFGHQGLAIIMNNRIVEPLNITSTRPERTIMFALGGGLRNNSNGERSLVWKGTLLDFDRSTAQPIMRWTVNGNVFEHLRPRGLKLNPFYTFGMTVVDHDRTTAATLDARWMQGRLGAGLEILFNETVSLIPDVRGGAGFTSIVPGNGSFAPLGFASDSMISGLELVGRGRVTGRLAFDFYRHLLVSTEVAWRSIGAGDPVRFLDLEAGLKYVHTVQYPFERLGFEVDVAVRRQVVASRDASQAITSFHTAIQFEL